MVPLPALDFLQEFSPVFLQFGLAHTGHFQQLCRRGGLVGGHSLQGGVGKDHIHRHVLGGGQLGPHLAQPVEESRVPLGQILGPLPRFGGGVIFGGNPHGHLGLSPQQVKSPFPPLQGGIGACALLQIPLQQHGVYNLSQLFLPIGGQNPIGRVPVKALTKDLFALAAPHHVQHHFHPVPVSQLSHTGGNLPGRAGHILLEKMSQAVVAVFTLGGGVFPKVVENVLPQAGGGVAVAGHGLQALFCPVQQLFPGAFVQIGVFLPVGQQEPVEGHVLAAVQEKALRRFPVPAGPACLLVIALQIFGHVVVDHKAHVGLVNAHAKGVGGHHHRGPVVEEILLVALALPILQARVVPGRRKAPFLQGLAHLFHGFPSGAVHNAALVPAAFQQGEKFLQLVLGAAHFPVQVGPVEACHIYKGVAQLQQL